MSEEEIKELQEHTDIIINEGLDREDDIQAILKKWVDLYNKEKEKNKVTIPTPEYSLQNKIHRLKEDLYKEKEKNNEQSNKILQLEEKNRRLETRSNYINEQNIKYQKTLENLQRNTIWKDKIKAKIEEYKATGYEEAAGALQELLEEKEI